MFPHTITIYHLEKIKGEDVYTKKALDGWYWHSENTLHKDSKGVVSSKATTIVSNVQNARNYGVKYNVFENDRIILGVGNDITSFKELNDCITVTGIEINVCGSDVDNITIRGV